MIIIGEKINGSRKQVARAIIERDVTYIQGLARQQVEAGANWLDIHAGTTPEQEPGVLTWLVEVIQDATSIPLCLDSPNPSALAAAIGHVKRTPMINSISGEKKRMEGLLPIVRDSKCPFIMLAIDDTGIPATVDDRIRIIRRLISETRAIGISDERVYIDPLVLSIATDTESGKVALNTMRAIKNELPFTHIVSGLSNVSFGLPVRTLINQAFVTLAISAGLDCAILDPLDKRLNAAILAAEVVLGGDRFCINYNRAYRANRLSYDKPE